MFALQLDLNLVAIKEFINLDQPACSDVNHLETNI